MAQDLGASALRAVGRQQGPLHSQDLGSSAAGSQHLLSDLAQPPLVT